MYSPIEMEAIARLLAQAPPRSDWTMLDLAQGEMSIAPHFASQVRQIVLIERELALVSDPARSICADPRRLPFAPQTFDVVILHGSEYDSAHLDLVVEQVGYVLKSGGLFMIVTDVLPEDVRSARYVQAFERLVDLRKGALFAEYEWRGMCLNSGLIVDSVEIARRRTLLLPWAQRHGCDSEVIERLHVLLAQAPRAVAAFWQPSCIGTHDAAFDQHRLLLLSRKP